MPADSDLGYHQRRWVIPKLDQGILLLSRAILGKATEAVGTKTIPILSAKARAGFVAQRD